MIVCGPAGRVASVRLAILPERSTSGPEATPSTRNRTEPAGTTPPGLKGETVAVNVTGRPKAGDGSEEARLVIVAGSAGVTTSVPGTKRIA